MKNHNPTSVTYTPVVSTEVVGVAKFVETTTTVVVWVAPEVTEAPTA
jgi:hypothetical protein